METLFSHKFTLPDRPDLEFEILPITIENYIEAARVNAITFAAADPLSIFMGISEEEVYKIFTLPLAKRNAENNLGIICYCITNKEIVATLAHEELILEDPDNLGEKVSKVRRANKHAYSQCAEQLKKWTQNPKEAFSDISIAVLPQYQKLGLGSILLNFKLYMHPVLKNARYIITKIGNPNMLRLALKSGYEIFWEKKWEEFKDVEGCEDFAQMDDVLEKKGHVRSEKLVLLVFDREKNEAKKAKVL